MLQYRTVYPQTLELLKELMLFPELQDFFLVGGTALALQIGHRISVDIDLFTMNDFDSEMLLSKMSMQFTVMNIAVKQNSLSFDIASDNSGSEAIEVDLIKYSYPLINPVLEEGSIRLLSIEDISAMKLSAIAGRGSKKDFYDIFYLLPKLGFSELFDYFGKKFPSTNRFQILKSLTYFDDADLEPDPLTIENIEWEFVKKTITEKVEVYLNSGRC